jgi:hypothetical protein
MNNGNQPEDVKVELQPTDKYIILVLRPDNQLAVAVNRLTPLEVVQLLATVIMQAAGAMRREVESPIADARGVPYTKVMPS